MSESSASAISLLWQRFSELGIEAEAFDYPPHLTVEEGKRLRGNMTGAFTKNLFLKDKKGRLFLVTVDEDRQLDIGRLHTHLPAQGRLSFVAREKVAKHLGVEPGTVSPLCLINDPDNMITLVLDADLLTKGEINMHPLVNSQRVLLTPAHLLQFARSCDHEPVVIGFQQAQT